MSFAEHEKMMSLARLCEDLINIYTTRCTELTKQNYQNAAIHFEKTYHRKWTDVMLRDEKKGKCR